MIQGKGPFEAYDNLMKTDSDGMPNSATITEMSPEKIKKLYKDAVAYNNPSIDPKQFLAKVVKAFYVGSGVPHVEIVKLYAQQFGIDPSNVNLNDPKDQKRIIDATGDLWERASKYRELEEPPETYVKSRVFVKEMINIITSWIKSEQKKSKEK